MYEEPEELWQCVEATLIEKGLPRTRENFVLHIHYEVPDTWCEAWEADLPPNLRIVPAPSVPFPDWKDPDA